MFKFKVVHQDSKTRARLGKIKTDHGSIQTPAFVAVATAASIKSLSPEEIKTNGTQVFFVNTYHLFLRPGEEVIKKLGGIHHFMNWLGPIMSDSGGFQVFSLAKDEKSQLVKVTDKGIHFRSPFDGSKHFFTPAKSIKIQHQLGADIIFCLDDCPSYPIDYQQAKASLTRTHRWAIESLETHQKSQSSQALYGIIQGSVYQKLRKISAQFIASLPFAGLAIGGVSVGESKKEMAKVCDWVVPLLPTNKPRHLLGVGEVDDIFNIIKRGIDTFDCVMPTRLGRMGHLLVKKQSKFRIDITKTTFKKDARPIESDCRCYTCRHFSRAYLNHLFRTKELLAYRLATIHNLHFINHLVTQIREAIKSKTLEKLEKEWLS